MRGIIAKAPTLGAVAATLILRPGCKDKKVPGIGKLSPQLLVRKFEKR
jgi:hypothetical protein